MVVISLADAAPKKRNRKVTHKHMCPLKRQLKEVELDEDAIHYDVTDLETMCKLNEMHISADNLLHLEDILQRDILRMLRLNVTDKYLEREPHLAGSCQVTALSPKSLRKVHKCYGLTGFPKVPHTAKKIKRLNKPKAAQLLIDQLMAANSYFEHVHRFSEDSSKYVWNVEGRALEERIATTLRVVLEHAVLYVEGNRRKIKKAIKCDPQRTTPAMSLHKVLQMADKQISHCLIYVLFHKIEDVMASTRDLIAVIKAPSKSDIKKPRSRKGRKNKVKKEIISQ